jgi:hypothetical protein
MVADTAIPTGVYGARAESGEAVGARMLSSLKRDRSAPRPAVAAL